MEFLRQVLRELRMMAWPSLPSVVRVSMVVLAVVVVLTAAVGLLELAADVALTERFAR
jgi:preprotein translocase SecE subunit